MWDNGVLDKRSRSVSSIIDRVVCVSMNIIRTSIDNCLPHCSPKKQIMGLAPHGQAANCVPVYIICDLPCEKGTSVF